MKHLGAQMTKRAMTLERVIPIKDDRTVDELSANERQRVANVIASQISIASGRKRLGIPVGIRPSDLDLIEVDDPYEPGKKLHATRSTRNDPLARLHSHHQIDQAQFMAGRAYQRDWELAERGAQAIDPTKEAVDGGRMPEPLSDSQGKARMRLVEIERVLGRTMHKVAHSVLVDGMSMEVMALRVFGRHGELASKYYGRMFRDALDVLAVEYRLASK